MDTPSLARSLLGVQEDLSVICICRFTYHEGLALLLSSAMASKSLHISRAVSYSYVTEFDTYAGFGPVGVHTILLCFPLEGVFFFFS